MTPPYINLPSPIQRLTLPLELLGVKHLLIKRDDLIHPIISGNKWRKLEYYLEEAVQKDLKQLLSFGGAYSNHLIALAMAAEKEGLKSIGIVRGEEASILRNPLIKACIKHGMLIKQVSRSAYKDKQALKREIDPRREALLIPEGGKGEKGLLGCERIAHEIREFLEQNFEANERKKTVHIIVPIGTGTTMGGISRFFKRESYQNIKIHGAMSLKGYESNSEFEHYCCQGNRIASVHHFPELPKYAKPSGHLDQLRTAFIEHTGIWIDAVYGCRSLYLIRKLIQQNVVLKDEEILLLHTGGHVPTL